VGVVATASQYLEYAEECRRIAQQLQPEQKKVLLEIANAWMRCAEEEQKKEQRQNGTPCKKVS
jgi:hypothetical protein